MKIRNSILNHLSSGGMIENIHRFIKGAIKFLRQYRDDPGVLGLNDYIF